MTRLPLDAAHARLASLSPGWSLDEEGRLYRRFAFPDFAAALEFTNRVGSLAEAEGHHPDILLVWGRVELRLWTHDAGGLTDRDFLLASAVDALGA